MKRFQSAFMLGLATLAIAATTPATAQTTPTNNTPKTSTLVAQNLPTDLVIVGYRKLDRGDYRGAIENANVAIKLAPDYPSAYNLRGVAYFRLGNRIEAIRSYNQALVVDPRYGEAYFNRAQSRNALGDRPGALRDFQIAAELYLQAGKMDYYQDAAAEIQRLERR